MFATYRPILSLLRGTAFLLAASGLHGLLLPLRGQVEGFSTASLGLMGTAWAGGFVTGCFFAPRLVRRVGHVRAFGAFAASGAIIALLTGLIIDQYVWILLRAFTGFTMAGAFMVIESWLNEKATNENRGTVFGLYMMVTYASIMAGQMIVAGGDVRSGITVHGGRHLLLLVADPDRRLLGCARPSRCEDVSLDIKGLYANSPVAFDRLPADRHRQRCLGHARRRLWRPHRHFDGRDRADDEPGRRCRRRHAASGRPDVRHDRPPLVLAGAAVGAALFALLIFLFEPRSAGLVIAMTAAYGAFAYTLYSIAVAHANDHASAEDFVKVSGGLLLLYGFGTMIGPVLAAGADGPDAAGKTVPGDGLRASLARGLHAAAHQPPRTGADREP